MAIGSFAIATSSTIVRDLRPEFPDLDLNDVGYVLRKLRVEPLCTIGITHVYAADSTDIVRQYIRAHSRKLRRRMDLQPA